MAVNVGQRNVPDNPENRALNACQAALDLALHTIHVCKNKNIFTEEYQEALTDDIIRCGKDIYIFAWKGYKEPANAKNGKWKREEEYLDISISKCNELLALINIAKRLFHLKGKKVRYWSHLTIEARDLIQLWYNADAQQYGV